MPAAYVTGAECSEWDDFASRQPYFALLQSWEWGQFKERLGWRATRLAVRQDGQIVAAAQMLIKPLLSDSVSIAYIPRGPLGRWLDPDIAPQLFAELHRAARLHRAVFLKIEPPLPDYGESSRALGQYLFRPSRFTNQPRATIILNLEPELDEIQRELRKTTRQCIRDGCRRGVEVHLGERADLPDFCHIMDTTARRAGLPSRAPRYYEQEWTAFAGGQQSALLMASHQEELLAVHLSLRFGEHAAYIHSGSRRDHPELHPNHLLLWEAIKWAKTLGCRTYDLWGIPDEVGQAVAAGGAPPKADRTDGLWGVYRFKSGFSRNIVCYIGAYDYVYNPLLYALMTNRLLNPTALEWAAARWDTLLSASPVGCLFLHKGSRLEAR